jgi:hypothetical protein
MLLIPSSPSYAPSNFHLQSPSFNVPLNSWNVSNVENFQEMFWVASSFNQPLDQWKPSSANNMIGMFEDGKLCYESQ